MGLMGKLKGLTQGRERQISQAVDKAGDVVDKRTKGKYSGHIQKAEDKVDDALGVRDDQAFGVRDDQALGVRDDQTAGVRDDRTPGVDGDPPGPARPAV